MISRSESTIQYLSRFSVYSVAEVIANLSGWIFTALAVRTLTIGEYGDLHFWIQLTMLFAVLVVPMRISVNKFLAIDPQEDLASLLNLAKILIFIASGIGLVMLATYSYWSLHFDYSGGVLSIVLLGFQLLLMVVAAWQRGALLAFKEFSYVSLSIVVELISRGILTYWAYNTANLVAFVISMVIPSVLIAIFMQLRLQQYMQIGEKSNFFMTAKVRRFYKQTAVFRIGVALMLIVDFVLVKWWTSAEIAGTYALIVLSGRVLFFLAQTFFVLLTPLVAPFLESSEQRRRLLFIVVGGYGIMSTVYIVSTLRLPEYTIGLIMGDKYQPILIYLPWYLVSVALLSMTTLATLFQILIEKYLFSLVIFAGLLAEILLLWLRHESLEQVVQAVFVTAILTLLMVMGLWVWQGRSNKV